MKSPITPTPQQRKAADPAASAWVSAHAGSGKTHVLVDRIIRLMLAGAAPSSILCLTYTKAAATEMASRVHQRLSRWVSLSDEDLRQDLTALGVHPIERKTSVRARQLFTAALETPGGFKIQTIHAFCEKILQLFPVEAGMAPGFTVLDSGTTAALLQQARDEALLAMAGAYDERYYAALIRHTQSDNLDTLLRQLLGKRQELAALQAVFPDIEALVKALKIRLGLDFEEEAEDVLAALNEGDAQIFRDLVPLLQNSSKNDQKLVPLIADLADKSEPLARLARLRQLFLTGEGSLRKAPFTKKLVEANPWLEDWLRTEQPRLTTLILAYDNLQRIYATAGLFRIAYAVTARFTALKQARGAYDFEDLILRTRALLTEKHMAQWVLYKLDRGIEHVLVDEAQDTSQAQWDIIRALTNEFFSGMSNEHEASRTLFVVGDHKQSIFSFQGANPLAFESSRHDFSERIISAQQSFHDVDLTISYRTTAEVLRFVDLVFAEGAPARHGLMAGDIKLLHHESNRKDRPGVFEIWPLMLPDEREEPDPWRAPVDRESSLSPRRKLARKIAATIKSWIGQRQIVSLGRTVQPGDILILFRTRNTLFDALISELRQQHIPVAGADRLRLTETLAVMDILALIRFLLLPQDDYSLACVLKSPLMPHALSEDELLALAAKRGSNTLFQRLQQSEQKTLLEDLSLLRQWQEMALRLPAFEFISAVLASRRKAILARLGGEAGDALDALLELALSFEQLQASSLSGFLHWIEQEDIEIKRNMDSAQGEVRLMTAHGAKGLEASIVILPDTTSLPNDKDSLSLVMLPETELLPALPLWRLSGLMQDERLAEARDAFHDLSLQEYRRLLYVAMTRARDELYICGSQSERKINDACWYSLIRQGLEGAEAQGLLQPFIQEDGSVYLRHGPAPLFTERDESQPVADKVAALPSWIAEMPEMASGTTERVAPSRLGGKARSYPGALQALRRGTVIHRLLQELPRLSEAAGQRFAQRLLSRHKLDDSLLEQVNHLLKLPDYQPFLAENAQAEAAIAARLPDGRVLSGTIDRLVIGEEEILLLDYKSDLMVPEKLTADHDYVRQLAGYVYALELAYPGRKVRAGLLWTQIPRLDWLDETFLQLDFASSTLN